MIIYLIRNTVTGKCYVGQTRRTLRARFNSHKRVVGRSNACKALSDAMARYSVEAFTIEVLRECSSQAEMDQAEMAAIEEYGTFSPGGYNLTKGGGGKHGYRHRPESIERTAAAHRGKPLTEEHRRKLSEALRGNTNAKGFRHTLETRQRVADAMRGTKRGPFTDEHRSAIAAARLGSKASDEVRSKMSASRSADGTPRPPHDIGCSFGRWTVISSPESVRSRYMVMCRCECGSVRSVNLSSLVSGKTKSCGCIRNEQTSQRMRKIPNADLIAKFLQGTKC